MPQNPFADLIPAQPAATPKVSADNPFADLIPAGATFDQRFGEMQAPAKPSLAERAEKVWNNPTPGSVVWLAKQAVDGVRGSVDAAKVANMTPQTEEDAAIISQAREALPRAAADAVSILSPGSPKGAGGIFAAPISRAPAAVAVDAARTALKPGQEVAVAARRLSESGSKVEVPRAVTTDSMAVQRGAAVTRNIPLAGDPLVKAAEKTIGQLSDKAAEVASGYGSGSVVAAGDAARSGIKSYILDSSGANKLYDKVDSMVDPAVKTPLSNTASVARAIEARRANAGISDQSNAVKRISEAVSRDGLNYEGIKDLRGYIRELKDNPSLLPADLSGKELNSIYDALSKDLRAAVKNAGGDAALGSFERANKYYQLKTARAESLAKIIGENGDAPAEKVFSRLLAMASSKSGADIVKLSQARRAMGSDDWNEFASGVIGQMGRDTANFSGPEKLISSGFSPQRFLTAYGNLSPAGKAVLFKGGGKGDLAAQLDDIARVSGRFKELMKFANPSGTGQVAFGGAIGAGLMSDPISTISSVIGGRMMAHALSKPASAASVAKWARAHEALARSPSPGKIATFNMATRNLIANLGARDLSPVNFAHIVDNLVNQNQSE